MPQPLLLENAILLRRLGYLCCKRLLRRIILCPTPTEPTCVLYCNHITFVTVSRRVLVIYRLNKDGTLNDLVTMSCNFVLAQGSRLPEFTHTD